MKMIDSFKKFLNALSKMAEKLQPFFLLVIRLIWGFLLFQAGKTKFDKMDATIDFFHSLHIPFPQFNSYLVAFVEMFGGAFLLMGLATRLISIPLIIVMVVALLTTQFELVKNAIHEPTALFKASPFTFLLVLLTVFVFGPGKFSLDQLIFMATSSKGKR